MHISLNGDDWQFKDFIGEDWRWRDSHKPVTRDLRFWRRGSVPGSVTHDLWTAGEVPDPYFERNSLLLEWVPARTWLYKKTFRVDEALRGRQIRLHFDGVDYQAEFFLNGASLGTHTGMYTPAVFDVSDRLNYDGDNLIAVVIEPAPHEEPQVGRTSRVRTHKSRMTYWWDFCPRMVHLGIWQDVSLQVTGGVRIDDVFARPQLAPDLGRAEVTVSVELSARQPEVVQVRTTIRLVGSVVATASRPATLPAGTTRWEETLTVESPRLWWPNGHGDQPLYEAEVVVEDPHPPAPSPALAGEGESDRRMVTFGIRRIEWAANEGAGADALPYTLVVNGRKVYIKGWNWVPIDVMYGVPRPDKLAHLLRLAKNAHVNLLRVWGGGLIETEAFYALADRHGILIWQEFIQSSSGIDNTPPESPAYIDMMVREAAQIIPRLRNHASLALWCGGNELTGGEETRPLDDTHPVLAALKAVVARLDPDRRWLPTSPTGPVFGNTLENIDADPDSLHDVHGPWEFQGVTGQYVLYNRSTSLLHSEFGVEGITNRKTLDAVIDPAQQHPVRLDNPLWQHLGAWWVKRPMWDHTFGVLEDVEMLIRATQFMQAEGLCYALEADRRRKFRSSGTLPWQFNEPYPMAACTSAVDYFGQPKPSYYAVARAYAPLTVTAKVPTGAWLGQPAFHAEIWANHSGAEPIPDARLIARLVQLDGQVHAQWEVTISAAAPIPADGVIALTAVECPLDGLAEVFFLDLRLTDSSGRDLAANRYMFTHAANFAPLLNTPGTSLRIDAERSTSDWRVTIQNTGANSAPGVWLEDARDVGSPGFAEFSDNDFCLLPGESRTVAVAWVDVPEAARTLTVGGWNTDTQTL